MYDRELCDNKAYTVARFLKLSPASAVSPIITKFSQYSPHSTCYSLLVSICKGPSTGESERRHCQNNPDEGRRRIKNLKSKGYENCSAEYKLIQTHFYENLKFFLIKLTFIETVFHILNRKLPQGMEVWPPGSLDINPFDYLKCGISRRDINRSSHKINSP